MLDGKVNNFDDDDKARRNTIVNLLEEWNLVKVVDASKVQDPIAPLSQIKILPYSEKNNWELVAKYSIGKKN
jgi:hypothetical protein